MTTAVKLEAPDALEVFVPQLIRRPLSQPVTALNAVTATGASDAVDTLSKGYVLWVARATAVTTGGTVLIQGCEFNSGVAADWYTIATINVSATATYYAAILEDEWHPFMRSNLTARTDGTYTTKWLASQRFAQ